MLTANAGSGQKIVAVTDASLFEEGISVTISDDADSEENVIETIADDTLTMKNNLANTYTTTAHGKVNRGNDYIEDTVSQGAPPTGWGGIYIKPIIDKSITHPDTLLAWALLLLAELKNPRISYLVDTVDLSESTEVGFSFEALKIGSTITVIDEDLGIDVSAQVVKITHPDLLHPEQMEIEVANRTKDIADSLAEVYDRQQLDQHIATKIGAGQVIVKGKFTVLDWATLGETTIEGSKITTGTIVLNKLDFVPLSAVGEDTDAIIATINATDEGGLKISAGKIEITAGVNIFKQPGIPTSEVVGDLWFDTDDDNKLYRAACIGAETIEAGKWELVQDAGIIANAAAIVVEKNRITLNVTDISNIDGRVTTAEGSISVNAGNILLKVSKDGVIGSINVSPEVVKISAAKVQLEGTVIFIGGAASDVNAGVTEIEGGMIKAGTLTVTSAEIVSLNANQITAGYLSAARIEAGSIDAKILTVAAAKVSGLLTAATIAVNNLTSGNLTVDFTITTGELSAASNHVIIGNAGVTIDGLYLAFVDGLSAKGLMGYTSGRVEIGSDSGVDIRLSSGDEITLYASGAVVNLRGHTLPYTTEAYDLGSSGKIWRRLYTEDITLVEDINPSADNNSDLGSSSYRFRKIYAYDMDLADDLIVGDLLDLQICRAHLPYLPA
ncbi:hypothetical protein ES708_20158 [subsurface metagenome]